MSPSLMTQKNHLLITILPSDMLSAMALPSQAHTHALLDGREVNGHYQFIGRQSAFNKINRKVEIITKYFRPYQFHTEF